MNITEQVIREIAAGSKSRAELWIEFARTAEVERMAEIGVLRGEFASRFLKECNSLNPIVA